MKKLLWWPHKCYSRAHVPTGKIKKEHQQKNHSELDRIVVQNKKEAQEKERTIEEVLRTFKEIWVDEIAQDKLSQIIAMVNLNPVNYGLQRPINLENGSLGFDYDFWNKSISLL